MKPLFWTKSTCAENEMYSTSHLRCRTFWGTDGKGGWGEGDFSHGRARRNDFDQRKHIVSLNAGGGKVEG